MESRQINILGKGYELVPVSRDELTHLDKREATGRIDCGLGVILFDISQNAYQYKETLMHEILHALEYEMQLEIDEKDIHRLSVGIYSVMKDNPEFAEWWIK